MILTPDLKENFRRIGRSSTIVSVSFQKNRYQFDRAGSSETAQAGGRNLLDPCWSGGHGYLDDCRDLERYNEIIFEIEKE